MNKVILRGHLGDDVRFNKTTTSQKSVANFRMATNKSYTDAAGNKVKTAEWHNVVAWERLAETVAQYTHKGSQVLVEGELRTREFIGAATYENGQPVADANGQPIQIKRYTTEVVARNIEFLDKAPQNAAYPGVAAQPGVVPAATPVAATPVAAVPPAATQFVVAAQPATNVIPAAVPVATAPVAPVAYAPVAPVAPVAAAPVQAGGGVVQPVVIPGL